MTTINTQAERQLGMDQWIRIGLVTAAAAVLAVLVVQILAITVWPDIALFKPLDSYLRTAVFAAIPAFTATGLFAWLATRKSAPVQAFIKIAAVVLILSIIPDYLIPFPNKSFLASTVTAFLHVVAAAVTVSLLVTGYQRLADQS